MSVTHSINPRFSSERQPSRQRDYSKMTEDNLDPDLRQWVKTQYQYKTTTYKRRGFIKAAVSGIVGLTTGVYATGQGRDYLDIQSRQQADKDKVKAKALEQQASATGRRSVIGGIIAVVTGLYGLIKGIDTALLPDSGPELQEHRQSIYNGVVRAAVCQQKKRDRAS